MFIWLFGSDKTPPVFLKFRSSKTFIIFVVALAIFTDIFAYGIVVPVFPYALTSRASIDPNDIQTWISILLAIYGAALLASAPIFGWLADRMGGRQIPFLLGLALLAGSTVILCVGNSIALFAVGRALQGASAAVVWVVGLTLLVDTVGADDVGTAMGYVGLAMSLGILLAPLLGGIVLANANYYSVYAMAFSIIGLDIILRFAMIEQKKARRWLLEEENLNEAKLDDRGESKREGDASPISKNETDGHFNDGVSSTRRGPKEKSSTREEEQRKDLNRTPSNAAEAAATTAGSTSIMRRIIARLPPVVFLFGSRRILSALWASVIQSSLLTAFDSILPLFVKDTFHWNSTGAGLIFLPIVIATFIGPLIGHLSDKYGPRWFATTGFVLACPALILLRLVTYNSLDQKVLLCALLAIVGVALTLALTPTMAEIAYAVEAKAKRHPPGYFGKHGAVAQSYALFNMAWAAGSMIGPLVGGLVNKADGWGTTTLILGCVSIFTAVPTGIWTGGSIFKQRRTEKAYEGKVDEGLV